ncbi:putative ATPase with chaperone activity [Bacillus benzoevorans]|uniref:Putative ATPase with chaperone activity n=1 Tax=Bacillus benzoevorans TaxID=1456 RepID=A0A7X0HTR6_9BACI|nr:putative ATPase with chaperone activity [Bacillus benzoevorans]
MFLDEVAEFQKKTLDMLRQPLETGKVTISRAQSKVTYPSSFILLAAMNPCPCGYLGSNTRYYPVHPNKSNRTKIASLVLYLTESILVPVTSRT